MSKYVPYIIIAVLLTLLVFSLTKRKEVVITKEVSDTVYSVKYDTVKIDRPVVKWKKVLDTIYIENSPTGSVSLPITQVYYDNEQYKAWVSGYEPNLDSIYVFSKTEYVTVTNTVTKEIYPKTTDLYVNVGAMYVNGYFAPKVSGTLKLRNNFTITGGIGWYDKSPMYEIGAGFKINK